MYSEKSLTWNGITQQNRNGLLWDKTLDRRARWQY
jgi:D-alanyl-D-alanine carboxypeptidase (penicillin-binding protein 5/6)